MINLLLGIFVIITYLNTGPNCRHIRICDDNGENCIVSSDDEVLEPLKEGGNEQPLMVEMKALIREHREELGKEPTQEEVKQFLESNPTVEIKK